MSPFRRKLAKELNRPSNSIQIQDSNCTYDDIIELTTKMNSRFNYKTQIQEIARRVLVSLFPPFILDRYPTWFARPFPIFSARMCAWATVVGGTWGSPAMRVGRNLGVHTMSHDGHTGLFKASQATPWTLLWRHRRSYEIH